MKTQLTLKTLLVIATVALLTACGNNKSTSSDSTAAAGGTPAATGSSGTGTAWAYCNSENKTGLTANITSYVTPGTSTIRPDYMRLRFSQLPSDFTSGAFIQFYRWQVDSSDNATLDSTPLNYRVEDNAGDVLVNFTQNLTWAQLSTIANTWNITDPLKLMTDLVFVIDTRDTTSTYQVLKIAYYSSTATSEVDMDMLMPVFNANPAEYAIKADGTSQPALLQSLHPFESMISQGSPSSTFQSLANAFCF